MKSGARACLTARVRLRLDAGTAICLILLTRGAFRVVIRSDMVSHMKTTVDIADPLLEAAKKAAAREGTTLRALVELGPRQVFEAREHGGPFRLRRASFGGEGLQPGAKDLSWEQIWELAYGERGR